MYILIGILGTILWVATGFVSYCIYAKYIAAKQPGGADFILILTIGLFGAIGLSFYGLGKLALNLQGISHKAMGIKPPIQPTKAEEYIGQMFRIIHSDLLNDTATPFKTGNVIRVTDGNDDYAGHGQIFGRRVKELSEGCTSFDSGDVWKDGFERAMRLGHIIEVSEDEKIMADIK